MTASDVHSTNIARSVSRGVREIRERQSENYKANRSERNEKY
nr:MAG TPA: hypothetical protein [Caudoviricetes sp.]